MEKIEELRALEENERVMAKFFAEEFKRRETRNLRQIEFDREVYAEFVTKATKRADEAAAEITAILASSREGKQP